MKRPLLTRRDGLALLAGAAAAPWASAGLVHEHHVLFGSYVQLQLPASAQRSLRERLMAGLARMHRQWNAWKPGELLALNESIAAGRRHRTTAPLRTLIRGAAGFERSSGGLFNPAIGGLVAGWGFHADELRPGARPSRQALAPWLSAAPSLAQLRIDGEEVASCNRALRLDFGAYAKGVAIDWALDLLRREGTGPALVDLGGNLAVMGRPQGRPWVIGIRSPQGTGLVAALAAEGREAIVTSGIYERYRWLDGQRATHVLDPRSGAPAATLASVTVIHPSAGHADAAATALLVAGASEWRAVARRMGVDQVLTVDPQGQVESTPALARRLIG